MRSLFASLVAAFVFLVPLGMHGAETDDLEQVQSLDLPNLKGVTSVTISKTGKFVYAAAYQASAISVFERDAESGKLTPGDVLQGPEYVRAISIRLSQDENYAAATHLFQARRRNRQSNEAVLGQGERG
jgi:hypothetical protein